MFQRNFITGVEVKVKHYAYPVLIQPTQIQELRIMDDTNEGVKIGASVTLTELEYFLQNQIREKPGQFSI